jgi:hypothetical protein
MRGQNLTHGLPPRSIEAQPESGAVVSKKIRELLVKAQFIQPDYQPKGTVAESDGGTGPPFTPPRAVYNSVRTR